MKEIAFALDLEDDPDTIRKYREWHGRAWPEITRGMAAYGVRCQNIHLIGNRLFMVLQVEERARLSPRDRTLSRGRPTCEGVGQLSEEPPATGAMGRGGRRVGTNGPGPRLERTIGEDRRRSSTAAERGPGSRYTSLLLEDRAG